MDTILLIQLCLFDTTACYDNVFRGLQPWIKDARLPFNSHQPLTEGVAAGIARSKRMAVENNLEFDINDPLGLRTSAQTYEDTTQEEFERQRLEDDRQAAVARNIAEDDEIGRAHV